MVPARSPTRWNSSHVADAVSSSIAAPVIGVPPDGASGLAARSVRLGPCRKSAQCVHIVVDDVGMRVLLPAAKQRSLEQIARAARIVDRIEREIERLACLARQQRGADGFRIQGQDGAVGRIHAPPGLAILILLMTNP